MSVVLVALEGAQRRGNNHSIRGEEAVPPEEGLMKKTDEHIHAFSSYLFAEQNIHMLPSKLAFAVPKWTRYILLSSLLNK